MTTIFIFVFAGDTNSLVRGQQSNEHFQISNTTRGKSAEVVGDSVRKVPPEGVDAERCAPRCGALLLASSPSGSVQPPEAAAAAGASRVFEEGSGLSWEGINEGLAIHQKGKFRFLAVVFYFFILRCRTVASWNVAAVELSSSFITLLWFCFLFLISF